MNTIMETFHFWLYFLSISFPESLDSETDQTLAEYLAAHYDCEAAQEWADDFVQYADGTVNDDGYAENPTTIEVPLQGAHLPSHFIWEIRFSIWTGRRSTVQDRTTGFAASVYRNFLY